MATEAREHQPHVVDRGQLRAEMGRTIRRQAEGAQDPRIFAVACESVGVEPEEAMYVGDNPAMDVGPAKEAGLIACWRRGSGKHADATSDHEPDLVIRNFVELLAILRDRYGVALPESE